MKTTAPQTARSSKKQRNGSTVVETIVALVIFATFISGAAKVIMSHSQLTDKARMHYTAINIAKNQVEQIRNMRRSDYDQILAMTENGVRVNAKGEPDTINGKYSRTTEITIHTLLLLEIEVTVEIFNPITLEFDGESEHIKSYMAKLYPAQTP